MNTMFSSVVATGVHACTPNTVSQGRDSIAEQTMSEKENDPLDKTGNVESSPAEARKCRKKGKSKASTSFLSDLVESTKDIGVSLREPPKSSCPFTIVEAVAKIESFPEFCEDFDFYDFATLFLIDKYHRELFMAIRDDFKVKWMRARYERRGD
ncbi:hypothetical protein KSP39_PZI016170 [Platanthera zijinensis]|uniref:Uncharacterized protein n=1 Tax=Platanthera zijinensis TaxID=2320716 RepID=A0AAP0G0H7_9ASPA